LILFAAVVVAVVLIAPINAISKYVRYNSAVALSENGHYAKAAEKFEKLENYEDSRKYAEYCLALKSLEEKEYDAASKQFKSLRNFMDSAEYQKIASYRFAKKLFEDGPYYYYDAYIEFWTLGDY